MFGVLALTLGVAFIGGHRAGGKHAGTAGTPILFEEPLEEAWQLPPHPAAAGRGIAIVLDDVGYDLTSLRRILALPYPIAVSVLPDAPFARAAAELAHRAGKVVMLHLPMEPANPKYRARMTDAFLREGLDEAGLRRKVEAMLARVPYAAGINNHMGSYLTSLHRPMRWLMRVCRERGLFFLDSRTTAHTVAAEEARKAGIVWGERQVFLDHDPTPEAIRLAWRSALWQAKRHGRCIVIAHPYPETVRFLESLALREGSAEVVAVTALLHRGA